VSYTVDGTIQVGGDGVAQRYSELIRRHVLHSAVNGLPVFDYMLLGTVQYVQYFHVSHGAERANGNVAQVSVKMGTSDLCIPIARKCL
jgi:hypothetical protein